MNMQKRMAGFLGLDYMIVSMCVFLTCLLQTSAGGDSEGWIPYLLYAIITATIQVAVMYGLKLYQRIWRFASIHEAYLLVKAVFISSFASYILSLGLLSVTIPVISALESFEATLLGLGGIRFARRMFQDKVHVHKHGKRRALIIGAGECGSMIAKELKQHPSTHIVPVAFIDDDLRKHKCQIHGIPVVGNRHSIETVVSDMAIEDIIIAIPSASREQIKEIIECCQGIRAKLKIIPALNDLIEGRVSIKEIRDVQVEDLLGREPVHTDLASISSYVNSKTVLVTGAGGSIGSELCRQIAMAKPAKLLLLGHGENSIYQMEMELQRKFPQLALETIIADVQDSERIAAVFRQHLPQVVFHAAAHKHVPLMECNPAEAIKNNVFGTKHVAECAHEYKAERFVLISSDKAVNPTSVMGATKRIAEMIVQNMNQRSETIFAAVRFGNVLGSRGSVILRFQEQIKQGGPVTVTHPEMIRYFMTIPEAVQLVLQAGALAKGGEVFILDMGNPMKIADLARDVIRLSGFEPEQDISITYTGMRRGEKLYEELLTSEEGITSTKHERIFIGKLVEINTEGLLFGLEMLRQVSLLPDGAKIRGALQQMVPSYQLQPMDDSVMLENQQGAYALTGT
ncbi:polysaccharide biosynthesis protein [Paenibacillus marinisediminis]